MFSGGVGSWATAKRVAATSQNEPLTLLFADTLMEDEDLYRFLGEAADNVGGQLVKVADGRTPWEVFGDVRFLGNTRVDPCSKILKRQLLRRWLKKHCEPENTTVYLGIDWTEDHRYHRAKRYWKPWRVEAPMVAPPYRDKHQMLDDLEQEGIDPPRLYAMGFPHNNCGGFCIKAGQGHFANLLKMLPERFAYHERKEQELRQHLGKDIAILRDRQGGKTKPMTLRQLRERIEADKEVDLFEWGGCGCFTG